MNFNYDVDDCIGNQNAVSNIYNASFELGVNPNFVSQDLTLKRRMNPPSFRNNRNAKMLRINMAEWVLVSTQRDLNSSLLVHLEGHIIRVLFHRFLVTIFFHKH